MNMMILSLSSTLSQAKGAVYAYEVVYQGAWAQHEEDDDGDDKAVWGVHHQRGRVHQEASGKDIYGDGQHLSANSSLEGMSNVSKNYCRVFHHLSIRPSCCISLNFLIIFLIGMTYDTSESGDVDDGVPAYTLDTGQPNISMCIGMQYMNFSLHLHIYKEDENL